MNAVRWMAAKLMLVACTMSPAIAGAASLAGESPGMEHNRLLGCLLDAGGPPADKAVDVLLDICGYTPEMPRDAFVRAMQPVLAADYSVPLVRLMDSQRKAFSAYEFSFFQRMDAVLQESSNWEDVDRRFAELEREAMRLDPERKQSRVILGGLSVGRHSAQFWSKVDDRLGGAAARKGWFSRLMSVVGADLKSYVSSFSIGGAAMASGGAAVKEIGEASGWW